MDIFKNFTGFRTNFSGQDEPTWVLDSLGEPQRQEQPTTFLEDEIITRSIAEYMASLGEIGLLETDETSIAPIEENSSVLNDPDTFASL